MYAIKMNPDKSLITTIKATIYQYEKNADTLIFLLPTVYEEKNLSDCTVLLRYILPDGIGKSEELIMCPEMYKDYYQYRLKISSVFTDVPGSVELWLVIMDAHDNMILKTGSLFINICQSKDITRYLSSDDRNQLDKLSEKVSYLEKQKADNLVYNEERQALQLTSGGVPIGEQVTISGGGGIIEFDSSDQKPDSEDETTDEIIYF